MEIPWNSMELPWNVHGVPWASMEPPRSPMELPWTSMDFHGLPFMPWTSAETSTEVSTGLRGTSMEFFHGDFHELPWTSMATSMEIYTRIFEFERSEKFATRSLRSFKDEAMQRVHRDVVSLHLLCNIGSYHFLPWIHRTTVEVSNLKYADQHDIGVGLLVNRTPYICIMLIGCKGGLFSWLLVNCSDLPCEVPESTWKKSPGLSFAQHSL